MPQEAEVLASYDHYNWKEYAAITKNHYGKGTAIYIGCMTDDNTLKAVLTEALNSAEVEIPEYSWPVIVRKGINDLNKCVRYILNYSCICFLFHQFKNCFKRNRTVFRGICAGWGHCYCFTLEFKDCGRSIKYSITYLSLYFVSCTSADCSLSLWRIPWHSSWSL